MVFSNFKKYRNVAITLCTLLAINTLEITNDRVIALEHHDIYLAQNRERDKASIENLLDQNLKAYETEDINALMTSIHPNSPVRAQTEELSKMAFSLYDLDHEYDNLEIIELSNTDATIQITQTVKKISGSDFKDNRVTSIQTLKKYNGQWKFFDLLAIENLEYLN